MTKGIDWIIFHISLDMCTTALLQKSEHMLYMRKQYGHLHYFSKETALATLVNVGYGMRDHFHTSDDEISGATVPRRPKKLLYELRRQLFCAVGSWGGQRPSPGGYVTGTGATNGVTARRRPLMLAIL